MAAINSNKSNIKAFTVVNGSLMLADEAARLEYSRNQQRESRRQAGTDAMDMGQRDEPVDATPEVDEKLQDAVDKDLSKRNLKTTKPTDTEKP